MRKIILPVILSTSLFTLSCGGEGKSIVSNQKEANTGQNQKPVEELKDWQMSNDQVNKFNAIIDCYNSFSTNIYDFYDRYTKFKGVDVTAYTKKKIYISSIDENRINKVNRLDEVISNSAFPELNVHIKQYKDLGLELSSKINEASKYYELGDYDIDDFAKGEELHEPLLNLSNKFLIVNDQLRYLTDSIQDSFELKRLEALKKQGKTIEYNIGFSLMNSRYLLIYVQSKGNLLDLDENKLNELILSLRNNYDALDKIKTETPKEFENYSINLSWYHRSLKEYLITAKELNLRVKNQEGYSNGDKMTINAGASQTVSGSPYKLSKKYNDMIGWYNKMLN